MGMRRTVLLLASMALAVLLACGAALAEEKLDQENVGSVAAYYDRWTFNGDDQYAAQVFTAGKTGKLNKVSIQIEKSGCGSSAATDSRYQDITVRIYSLGPYSSTLTTSATPVASTTLPASQVSYQPVCGYWYTPPLTDVTFYPDHRVSVLAGRMYAIALEPGPTPSGTSAQRSYYWYYDYGAYSDGTGYRRYVYLPGVSFQWERLGVDFKFRTYVDVPDSDGDGLTNDVDQCDYDPGPASMNGCPISMDTVSPKGSVKISGGARITRSRTVVLSLSATDPTPSSGVDSVRIKNAGGAWTSWKPYSQKKDWKLARGEGKKTIYVQYKDAAGNLSSKASDSITYKP
jgi:hypothetical protein